MAKVDNQVDQLLRQQAFAGQLREEQAQTRIGANDAVEENKSEDETFEQQQRGAQMANKQDSAKAPTQEGAEAGGASDVSPESRALQVAWGNMLDPFGIPLSIGYFNFHWFMHAIGDKKFCAFGEEWIPPGMAAGPAGEALKSRAKGLGQWEKAGVVLMDVIVFIAVLGLLALILLAFKIIAAPANVILRFI
jgi:hypothetical protein